MVYILYPDLIQHKPNGWPTLSDLDGSWAADEPQAVTKSAASSSLNYGPVGGSSILPHKREEAATSITISPHQSMPTLVYEDAPMPRKISGGLKKVVERQKQRMTLEEGASLAGNRGNSLCME